MPNFRVRLRPIGSRPGPAGFSPLTDVVVEAPSAAKAAARARWLKWGSHPKEDYVTEADEVEIKLIAWLKAGRADHAENYTQSHATIDSTTTLCGRRVASSSSYTDTIDHGVSCKKCQTALAIFEAAS